MACSSMSYTPFAFYGLMLSNGTLICVFCILLYSKDFGSSYIVLLVSFYQIKISKRNIAVR